MAKEHDVTPLIAGMLDLDEPELPAENLYHDVSPPPDWGEDDLLIIDVGGHIHVRGGRFFESRVVGRVRGEEGEASIGALVARFEELEERLKFLEREIKGSRNLVRSLKSMRSYVHWVEGADAIGDFAGLLERAYSIVDRLEKKVESSRSKKRLLVDQAESLMDSTAWKATGETMEQLMEAWKKAGSAGGEEDDALWERFRAARSSFFDRRSENFAELKRSRAADRKVKEGLIARAEALSQSTDWDETSDAMQELLDEWKLAGSAGRKFDEELWQQFRAARDPFYERRKAFFAQQRRENSKRSREERGRRQDGGRRPERGRFHGDGRPPGGSRSRSGGTLHASLAEILGPMSDLLAKKNEDGGKAGQDQSREKRRSKRK